MSTDLRTRPPSQRLERVLTRMTFLALAALGATLALQAVLA